MANEKRLIDANKICDGCGMKNYECCGFCYVGTAPTVDAVEVVRCKDCNHITPVEGGLSLCTLHHIAVAYNDFCSYGERKDGNGNDLHRA